MVEAQLHRHDEPVRHGWGVSGQYLEQAASWVAYYEEPHLQEHNPIASFGGAVSLIPNRAALLQALTAAGFTKNEILPVPDAANRQYADGDRVVVAAYA